jgi:hypothetical protein
MIRFIRAAWWAVWRSSVGLILAEASARRISIPLDLSSHRHSYRSLLLALVLSLNIKQHISQLTHTRCLDGTPETDGALKK